MWTGAHFEMFTPTVLMLHSRKNVTLYTGGCGPWRFVNSQHYCAAGWHRRKKPSSCWCFDEFRRRTWWKVIVCSTVPTKATVRDVARNKAVGGAKVPAARNEVVDSESINICSSAATVPNCRLSVSPETCKVLPLGDDSIHYRDEWSL